MEVHYRDLGPNDLDAVAAVIERSFRACIADTFSVEGVAHFLDFVSPERMRQRLAEQEHFALVAESNQGLVGIIEIRERRHVLLLFVDPALHGRGIARALFDRALARMMWDRSGLEEITVNSSQFAEAVYVALGFHQTAEERIERGIRFIPMAMRIRGEE